MADTKGNAGLDILGQNIEELEALGGLIAMTTNVDINSTCFCIQSRWDINYNPFFIRPFHTGISRGLEAPKSRRLGFLYFNWPVILTYGTGTVPYRYLAAK
jgi:hypothetical protein